MSSPRRAGFAPVVFDDHFWWSDLSSTSARGREVATTTRRTYERAGCPVAALRRCDDLGSDGTQLAGCVKVYLPPPAGPFGMVPRIVRSGTATKLALLAFGVRHPPRHSHATSVYKVADRRLHE
jgi:hypothetical protein